MIREITGLVSHFRKNPLKTSHEAACLLVSQIFGGLLLLGGEEGLALGVMVLSAGGIWLLYRSLVVILGISRSMDTFRTAAEIYVKAHGLAKTPPPDGKTAAQPKRMLGSRKHDQPARPKKSQPPQTSAP